MPSAKALFAAGALLLPLSGLGGCDTLRQIEHRRGLLLTEASWQALHAADFSQTITIARRPDRYEERGLPTEWVIGRHPSESAVAASWAGFALLHLAVTGYLAARADRGRLWRWALHGWEALTLTESAATVAHNSSIGLRPFSHRQR